VVAFFYEGLSSPTFAALHSREPTLASCTSNPLANILVTKNTGRNLTGETDSWGARVIANNTYKCYLWTGTVSGHDNFACKKLIGVINVTCFPSKVPINRTYINYTHPGVDDNGTIQPATQGPFIAMVAFFGISVFAVIGSAIICVRKMCFVPTGGNYSHVTDNSESTEPGSAQEGSEEDKTVVETTENVKQVPLDDSK